jgi:hypothetical protein
MRRFPDRAAGQAAKQSKALRGEVDDWRRDVDPAVEPRFDRMLVTRLHVHQVTGLQRADMRGDDLVRHLLILIALEHGPTFL